MVFDTADTFFRESKVDDFPMDSGRWFHCVIVRGMKLFLM